jgi:hypothetical protein
MTDDQAVAIGVGRESHPLESSDSHGALFRQLTQSQLHQRFRKHLKLGYAVH